MKLKEFRHQLGMTQQGLADALGVSRNYITMVETGQRPESASLLAKVSALANRLDDVSNAPQTAETGDSKNYSRRLDAIEARLSTIEQLLLKVLARLPGK